MTRHHQPEGVVEAPGCELTAVCDAAEFWDNSHLYYRHNGGRGPAKAVLAEHARQNANGPSHDSAVYVDYRVMLDRTGKDIDAVLVATPNHTHHSNGTEPSFSDLERQFRKLPMETRRLIGPLFRLHGDESRERLEMYVGKVAEGGNGCFTAESRPHNDWLGERWYQNLGICLQATKKHDLKLWIFDEKWWPSGEVGGKVSEKYGSKRLVATATNVVGPTGELMFTEAARRVLSWTPNSHEMAKTT